MKNKGLIICIIVIILGLFIFAVFLPTNNNVDETGEKLLNIDYTKEGNELKMDQYNTENPVVAMHIQGYGSVVFELYPDIAPNTVNNFISLIKKGYYDNNTFHRLAPGFVLQGGDQTGTGSGGPGYTIKGEFTDNGFTNELKHEKGVLSMARGTHPDSGGGQFFIMLGTKESLDGRYAAFGRVIDGMDIIEEIEEKEAPTDGSEKLAKVLIIEKTVVDLKGKEYPEVEKLK